MNHERLAKYDNLKGLLILLVIFGHLIAPKYQGDVVGNIMYITIYMFHMPLFLYIAGKFSHSAYDAKLWKRVTVFLILYIILHEYELSGGWYMLAIALYTLIAPLFKKNNVRKIHYIYFAVACIIAIVSGFISATNYLYQWPKIICGFPFFLSGRFGLLDMDNNVAYAKKSVTVACGMLAAAVTAFYIVMTDYDVLGVLTRRSYADDATTCAARVLIFMAACLWIVFFMGATTNKKISLMNAIGKHTLFIYFCSLFITDSFRENMPADVLLKFVASIMICVALWGLSIVCNFVKNKVVNAYKLHIKSKQQQNA